MLARVHSRLQETPSRAPSVVLVMTLANEFAPSIDLVKSIRGAAHADIRVLNTFNPDAPRRVVWINIEEEVRRGALSADACLVIETAATIACDKRYPLVMSLGSSGADIVEGTW